MAYDPQKVWEQEFGYASSGHDFTGREVRKSECGNSYSPYGWDIDHIMPVSLGGSDTRSTLQIVNIQTNREKANKTSFIANFRNYQVKRKGSVGYYDTVADYDYSNKDYIIVRN